MKFFVAVAILALFAGVLAVLPPVSDEMKAKITQAVEECKQDVNLSEEDSAKIVNMDFANPSENLKCLANCILEKFGAIKDGVVQNDLVIEKLGPVFGEAKTKAALDKCSGLGGDNKCETAYNVMKCLKDNKDEILA